MSRLYRKVSALIIRDRALLLITATAAPGTYSLPGGPQTAGDTRRATLERELRAELGVGIVSCRDYGYFRVRSGIDGALVCSRVHRVEISGEPHTLQNGRTHVWARRIDDLTVSTTVTAVWASAAARGLVGGEAP